MPSDINLEEMDNESSGATPKAIKPGQSNPPDRDQVVCVFMTDGKHLCVHLTKTAFSQSTACSG